MIDETEYKQLKRYSEKTGVPVSEAVRRILRGWLKGSGVTLETLEGKEQAWQSS